MYIPKVSLLKGTTLYCYRATHTLAEIVVEAVTEVSQLWRLVLLVHCCDDNSVYTFIQREPDSVHILNNHNRVMFLYDGMTFSKSLHWAFRIMQVTLCGS